MIIDNMRLAKVENDYSISLGNSIPLNAWVNVTSTTSVNVATTQAIFIIRINDDAFWGFCYAPSSSSPTSISVPAGSAYVLFTKPESFTGYNIGIALESSLFPDPALLINGVDDLFSNYGTGPTYLSYYKFDIRPYFNQ